MVSSLNNFQVTHISEVRRIGIFVQGEGAPVPVKMTKDEWVKLGTQLYGPNMMDWKFICPACGNIARPRDFYPYKDTGANPDTATHQCIGRYDGHIQVVMGEGHPCNYTGYGLIDLCPVIVVDGEHESRCFAFADKISQEVEA
jgi:hypothetical protein